MDDHILAGGSDLSPKHPVQMRGSRTFLPNGYWGRGKAAESMRLTIK